MEHVEQLSDFLIAEYNALQARAGKYEEIKTSRLNFYLIIVAACCAGISSLAQLDYVQKNVINIVVAAEFVVLLLGVATLHDLTNYSLAIVMFHRRAGRIRRWFVDLNESVSEYVAFHPADDRPKFSIPFSILSWRGAESIVIIINSCSTSVILTCMIYKISSHSFEINFLIFLISFVLAWLFQIFFVGSQMKRQQYSQYQLENIRFPYEEYVNKSKNIE